LRIQSFVWLIWLFTRQRLCKTLNHIETKSEWNWRLWFMILLVSHYSLFLVSLIYSDVIFMHTCLIERLTWQRARMNELRLLEDCFRRILTSLSSVWNAEWRCLWSLLLKRSSRFRISDIAMSDSLIKMITFMNFCESTTLQVSQILINILLSEMYRSRFSISSMNCQRLLFTQAVVLS